MKFRSRAKLNKLQTYFTKVTGWWFFILPERFVTLWTGEAVYLTALKAGEGAVHSQQLHWVQPGVGGTRREEGQLYRQAAGGGSAGSSSVQSRATTLEPP